MATAKPKLTLNPSRDIPFDKPKLSPANVRRTRPGDAIVEQADEIARRGLLQSLSVWPELDDEGRETGRFEIPVGGCRFRALELLVKRKTLAKDTPIPCIVRRANCDILSEDDSLAENAMRENLLPLDQIRAMQAITQKGKEVEDIAAHFFLSPAVGWQRLRLAGRLARAPRHLWQRRNVAGIFDGVYRFPTTRSGKIRFGQWSSARTSRYERTLVSAYRTKAVPKLRNGHFRRERGLAL